MMQAPAPNTRPLRAPLRGTGMTRPNAAVALESAAKARAAMQSAQQRGSAAGGQPIPAAAPQGPQRAPQAAPQRPQAPQAQPGRGAPAQPAPVAYPNPEWNPRAAAAKTLQGLPQMPQVGPVAMPGGMAPAGKPGGNIMASMAPGAKNAAIGAFANKQQSALGAGGRGVFGTETGFPLPTPGYYSSDEEEFDPLAGEFMPNGVQVSDPLNDPSMWGDMTEEFEADYGTPEEQKAKQDAALAFQEQTGMTPEEMAGIMGMGDVDYGALLEGADGSDELGLAGLMPEGWDDTAALAGQDENDWANDSNPGPGWSWDDATGKWTQEALPPGVSADDPRWTYNEESGKWQLHDYEKDGALVDSEYMGEWAKGLIEGDVEDHMNPYLDEQKKEAWDQAQAANYQVAQALGARGIGSSGLSAMGMGDIFKATQNNVQGLEFDEYTRAAEIRLKEIQLALSGRQGDLSIEAQKELADEAAKLEKEMAQMQYAREDKDNIWTDIDNHAAAFEKNAPNGWDSASLSAYRAWASTPGNDLYKSVITVDPVSGKILFDKKKSDQAMKDAGFSGGDKGADPTEVGFEDWWLDTPESAYDNYVNNAMSIGAPRMSFKDFAAWVWNNYQIQLPGGTGPSGGSSQSKEGDPDYGDGDGPPPGMTPEEQAAWFEDEDGLEGYEG